MNDAPTLQLLDRLKQALAARQRASINTIIVELLARDAPIGRSWRALAEVLLTNGELALARAAGERYLRHTANAPAARFFHASVLARSGDAGAALDVLATVPADTPSVVEHGYTRGTIALNLGRFGEARADLLRAVAADPRSGQSWLALAMTGKGGGSDDIATRILAATSAMSRASAIEQGQYWYACGKVLDDLDRRDDAFDAFARGAALVRAALKPDAALDRRSATAAVEGFDRATILRFNAQVTVSTQRPIIVTGSPRSGTTLVEQILASHSGVAGGEELGRFGLVAGEIGSVGAPGLDRWIAGGRRTSDLAALYLHLMAERFGADGRAVDKTPDASRYLGLLASILPDAKIVWLRRDPLDRAWSCLRTFFLRGATWSYDQRDIAAHFRLEDALFAHWHAVLGDRLLVVDYETLVAQPDTEIRRLLAHCELDAKPQVFQPHRTERVVATASLAQVREPINTRAIGAAARYRRHLQPFIDAYGYPD